MNFQQMHVVTLADDDTNSILFLFMFTKFASYKVPPVMVSTHGSVVPLAMFITSFTILALVGNLIIRWHHML